MLLPVRLGLLLALAFSGALPAYAAAPLVKDKEKVHVGALDGTAAPSLAPMGSPSLAHEEKLPDSGLPLFFEKNGDWRGAAGAWQELAYSSNGDIRRHALVQAALDLAKSADSDTASRLGFLLLNGDAPSAPDSLTRAQVFTLLLPLAEKPGTPANISLTTVLAARPATPLRNAALYRLIWLRTVNAAPDTPVGNTYQLPLAEKLALQTADLDKHLRTRVYRAEIFGAVLPGLGHAWLGKPGVAAAVLPLWALLLWLVLWCGQRRQWPLMLFWLAGALGVWAASPLLAGNTAQQQNQTLRGKAIAQWLSLQPAPLPLTLAAVPKTVSATVSAAADNTNLPPLPGIRATPALTASPTPSPTPSPTR